MIVCQCGAENPDDARFCAACGAFLEWEAASVDRTGQAGPPAPLPPAIQAAQAVRPVEPGQPVQPVEPVQPGEPEQRRRPPRPPEESRAPRPGEIACPRCGTGNDPARRYCRSCGAALAEPRAPAPVPWWRRLFTRRRRVHVAGERPPAPGSSRLRRLVWTLVAVCVLAVLAVFGPMLVSAVRDEVRDVRGERPIRPVTYRASSAATGASARYIGDSRSDRYWAPTGKAAGAWVEASFAEPVRLRKLLLTPGTSLAPDTFVAHGRPRKVEIRVVRSDGTSQTKTVELPDQPGGQTYWIRSDNVDSVRFTVLSTYAPAAKPLVAVSEVEFWGVR